jgi:hypothetical protein
MARGMKLGDRGVSDLLGIYGEVLDELVRRDVVRSRNAPTGDYAEWLVHRALGGRLEPKSNKSADLVVRGRRIQVKSRVLGDTGRHGERQLSTLRSWEFDEAVIVLFDRRYEVFRAARIGVDQLKAVARPDGWVRGNRVYAREDLLDLGRDITEKLRAAAARQDD